MYLILIIVNAIGWFKALNQDPDCWSWNTYCKLVVFRSCELTIKSYRSIILGLNFNLGFLMINFLFIHLFFTVILLFTVYYISNFICFFYNSHWSLFMFTECQFHGWNTNLQLSKQKSSFFFTNFSTL